ncbi:MAG: CPCC family cysteine-rich protein [Planctomycetota bacterium]
MSGERFPCPCCRYYVLPEKPPGSFNLCPICDWEDDPVQYKNPNDCDGCNAVSLNEARKNFEEIGASEMRSLPAVRLPFPGERRASHF